MDCDGSILITYTPIEGLTPLTTEFMRAAGIEIEDHLTNAHEENANG
jgi:hypothetical protein